VMPKTKEEIILIKGWGEKKIQKYGDEFLQIWNAGGATVPAETNLEMFVVNTNDEQPSLFQTRRISLANPTKPEVGAIQKKESVIPEPVHQEITGAVSVSEFLGNINSTLSTLGLVKIKGEIADVGLRTGYAFFELKDSIGGFTSEASLGCFVGWRCFEQVKHLLESGMEVIISGYPKIYLKNGSFRLEVTDVEPVGEVALQKAFEALKRELEEKGYFDEARKRAIPQFIRKIGLITSMSGAAVIDFQKNLGPCGFQVECLDVRVEGDSAEDTIVLAIKAFNEQKSEFDALVLIRGGGSLQSLKAFNSEKIADAIYYSRIPVITGIGHERDETIAGFTADLNCSTPTAVANFLRTQHELLQSNLQMLAVDLVRSLDGKFEQNKLEIFHQSHYLLSSTERIFHVHHVQIDSLHEKLRYGLQRVFVGFQSIEKMFAQSVMNIQTKIARQHFQRKMQSQQLINIYAHKIQKIQQNVNLLSEKISCLNPDDVLKRGYSIAYDKTGHVLKKSIGIQMGEEITLRFSDGKVFTEVKKISVD